MLIKYIILITMMINSKMLTKRLSVADILITFNAVW